MTLKEATDDLIADYKTNGRKSLRDVRGKITMHLLPFFGERRRMVSIGTPEIRRFIAERQTGAVSTDILHLPARVVVTAGPSHVGGRRNVLAVLSGVSERPMMMPMTAPRRAQQRYDHRLRDLVQGTRDMTIATDLGIPRSTARGWLGKAPKVVVSLDVMDLRHRNSGKKSLSSGDA